MKINKKVTINFISLLENPEVLFQKNAEWEKLKVNEKVIDALDELSLSGCKITIEHNLDKKRVSDFYEENGIYEIISR